MNKRLSNTAGGKLSQRRLLAFQQYSIYDIGGGSRIIRRLFEGRESQITSLAVCSAPKKRQVGMFSEVQVAAMPVIRFWHRGPLRTIMGWLRENKLASITSWRVRRVARTIPADVVHILAHGVFCAALCDEKFLCGRPLWVSFHDHYRTCGITAELNSRLWNKASRRFVISPEMGMEYEREFGERNWDVITDGIDEAEIQEPKTSLPEELIVYFGGLLHVEYYPLFASLANALDVLAERGFQTRVVLRGAQELPFLKGRRFSVECRPPTLQHDELRNDLLSADILYLPIKFGFPAFSRFSLSTKMVGYLAAPGAIFYHGPEDAAVCRLLAKMEAAALATSTDTHAVVAALLSIRNNFSALSGKAKILARANFLRSEIQARFWGSSL